MAIKVKVQQLKNGQYVVTIPKQVALLKGLKKKEEASWIEDSKGNLVLKFKKGDKNET